jgi:type I restriction enzyme S subunit
MGVKTYPAYRDSGVEWIGEIPEHWEVKRTKSVVSILKVIAGKLGYEVISVTQRGLRLKDTSSFDGQNAQDYSKYQLVHVDDYVLNHMDLLTGYVGKSTYLGVTSPDYRVVRTIDTKRTDRNFTLFLFQNCYHHRLWYKYGQGAAHLGRWRLPRQEFNEFQLPSPPLEEQKQLAAFLDRETSKIDTLIGKQQQLINLLKEKRGSLISTTVTKGLNPNVPMKDSGVEWIGDIPEHWEVKRLRFLSSIDTGSKDTVMADVNGAYPFYVRSQIVESISTYSFDGPAVITAGDGAGVGKVFHLANGKFDVHQRCYVMHNFKAVTPEWCFNFVSTFFGPVVLAGTAKSTVESLRRWMLSDFELTTPPLEEQKQIASFLDAETSKIDTLIEKANQSIALLKERRSSLISAAVTGKIDVREAA